MSVSRRHVHECMLKCKSSFISLLLETDQLFSLDPRMKYKSLIQPKNLALICPRSSFSTLILISSHLPPSVSHSSVINLLLGEKGRTQNYQPLTRDPSGWHWMFLSMQRLGHELCPSCIWSRISPMFTSSTLS